MDYLRRLLLRSLAVPREQGSPVFDPFARVAGWEFDAAAPRPPESGAEPANGMLPAPAVQPLESAAAPLTPVQTPPFDPPTPTAGESNGPPMVPQASPSLPDALAPPARSDTAVAPGPQRELLTQADAFMRSLGMKSVAAPEQPAALPAPAAPGVPPPSRARTSMAAPHTIETTGPVLVRPAIPPASEHPRVPSNPRRQSGPATSAPAPATSAAAPPSAAPTAAAPQRIVQTTVVVAAAARGLDDLAHSSGISRFGLGQS